MEEPDQHDPAGSGTTQAEAEKRSASPKPVSEVTSDGKASSAATAAEVKLESPPGEDVAALYPGIPVLPDLGRLRDNRRDVPLTCQVVGCGESLSGHAEYYRRYRVCKRHLKGSALIVDGVPQRFCQQCGRFHLLEAFDGEKRNCRARLEEHNSRRRKVMALGGGSQTTGSRATRRESERHGRGVDLRGAGIEVARSPKAASRGFETRKSPAAGTGLGPAPPRLGPGPYLEPEMVMSVLHNMGALPLRSNGPGPGPGLPSPMRPPVGRGPGAAGAAPGPWAPRSLEVGPGAERQPSPARSPEPLLTSELLDLAARQHSATQPAYNLLERFLSDPLRSAMPLGAAGPVSASTATHVDVGSGSYGAGRGDEGPLSQEVNQLLSLWSTAGLPSEELGRMLSGNGSRQLSVGSLLPQLSSLLGEAGLGPGLLPRAASSPVFLESSSPRQASLRLLRGADPGAEQRSPFHVVVPGQPGPSPSRHLVPTVPRSGLSQDGSVATSARDANGTPAPDASLFESLSNPFERRGSSSQRMSSGGTSGGADGGMGPPPAKRIALARSVSFVPAAEAGLTPTSAVGPERDAGAAGATPQLTPAAMALLPAVNQLLTELMAVRRASGSPVHSQVNLLRDLLQQLSAGHHR